MGFAEELSTLTDRAEDQVQALNTKEKTKNALLLPFFEVLGYDAFNVREVEPRPVVELAGGSHKEVDYAVNIDGAPAMLFQCEEATAGREAFQKDTILRHLEQFEASVVVLTNGLSYWFYTEVAAMGGANSLPFLKFDLFDYDPERVTDLKRFTKSAFDAEEILSLAFKRQHTQLLQNYFAEQQKNPDEHFVRFLAAQIHEGGVSEDILGRLQPVVQTFLEDVEVGGETNLPGHDLKVDSSTEGTEFQSEGASAEERAQNEPNDHPTTAEGPIETEDSSAQDNPQNGESKDEDLPEDTSDNGDLQQETNIGKELARKVIGE